jgi:mRNA-degrading endonuclease toxin of MazEF toxin-antitoxin module
MTLSRGDVVLFRAPLTGAAGAKIRPMLVIQCDTNNARMSNTILAQITSNLRRAHEPTQVLIDLTTPEGQQSGLNANSAVTCENLLTARQVDVLRTLGTLSARLMAQVYDALKASLGLP